MSIKKKDKLNFIMVQNYRTFTSAIEAPFFFLSLVYIWLHLYGSLLFLLKSLWLNKLYDSGYVYFYFKKEFGACFINKTSQSTMLIFWHQNVQKH
jgi:hypothetical protein